MSKIIRLFEMFSGYGGASFSLKKAGINFVSVGHSEIDKFAIECWNNNHQPVSKLADKIPNFGDCTKINPNKLPDFDLLTGGFPCQSFSIAGKGLGEQDTRGTLFHDIIRIAEVKQPKYMLLENVKGLTTKRHKETFEKIKSELIRIGYKIEVKVLNTKEYGIPQNRDRVFFACFRDVMDWYNFKWPKKEELKILLKDILEDEVDEKYYLPENQLKRLLYSTDLKKSFSKLDPGVAGCMTARQYSSWRGNFVTSKVKYEKLGKKYSNGDVAPANRLYSTESICLTIINSTRILIKNATKKGYLEGYPGDGVNLEQPNSATRRGRIQKNVMGTLQANDQRGVITQDFRIRKLTPTECFRLMGFNGEINLDGLSNTQKYKLAGNGWDINLVSKIFIQMFNRKV